MIIDHTSSGCCVACLDFCSGSGTLLDGAASESDASLVFCPEDEV
uniref:Uncharacterized protein n=1 Tax=Setaria italica TaxID=4555 RepID=K3Z1Q3_SETIT